MSQADLDRALDYIECSRHSDFVGPRAEAVIDNAEVVLGTPFPPTYRSFLARLGCGSVAGKEFYGITSNDFQNSGVPDAIWITLTYRKSARIPTSLIVVGDTGDGGLYVIDTKQRAASGECPIFEWWGPEPEGHRMIASDFGDFLWNTIRSHPDFTESAE